MEEAPPFALDEAAASTSLALLTLGLLFSLLLWSGLGVYLYQQRDAELTRVEEQLKRAGHAASSELEGQFSRLRALLAISEAALHTENAGVHALLGTLLHDRALAAKPLLLKRDGWAFAPDEPGIAQYFVGDRTCFRRQLDPARRGFCVGAPMIGPLSGEWEIPLVQPLAEAVGEFVALGVSLPQSPLLAQQDSLRPQPGGSISVLRDDGVLLTRAPPRPELIGRSLAGTQLYRERITRAPYGVAQSPGFVDGCTRCLHAFATVEGLPLIVVASINVDTALMSWRELALVLGLAALLVTLPVLVATLRYWRWYRRGGSQTERSAWLALQTQSIAEFGCWALYANTRVSPAAQRLPVALQQAILLGRIDDEDDEELGRLLLELRAAHRAETDFDGEYRLKDAGDNIRWLQVSARAQFDRHGRYVAQIGVAHDVTVAKQTELELRRLALHDNLTGVLNRRSLIEHAGAEMARAFRYARPLALIRLDLDHFKFINDRFGHGAGDRCLHAVAVACAACLRDQDRLGRIGGGEFAVVLPETGAAAAEAVAERMRREVRVLRPRADDGMHIELQLSAGVTERNADEASVEALFARAGRQLYRAKHTGRDRVCSS